MKNKIIRYQRIKFICLNLFSFLFIFLIISIVTIGLLDKNIYSEADQELSKNYERILNEGLRALTNNPPKVKEKDNPDNKSPRINFIIYEENLDIYLTDLPMFDYEDLKEPKIGKRIYNLKIERYNYRICEFDITEEDNLYYIQILINIDGELYLRNNINQIFQWCLLIIIVLTLIINYFLSWLTTKPIAKSMQEQTYFVSDASHELRTPLTVLRSRLEHLLNHPNDKIIDQSEEISDCLAEVNRLTNLSNDLLSLARSDADKLYLELSEFDIYELIQKITSPFQEIALNDEKEFRLKGESIIICADREKIMQALIVLFDNAIKYTNPKDVITVLVKKYKNKCEIVITDTGIGISEKGMSQVFNRFYRDDNSRGATEGNGLGLAIAKQIIVQHRGSITVSKNIPKGTIFIIIL